MKRFLLVVNIFGLIFFVNAQTLYGLTSMGGSGNYGVMFSYDISTQTYTIKKNFDIGNTTQGIVPRGSLTKTSGGKLYGMTYLGGTNNSGTLFEYDPATENYAVKVNMSSTNGTNPFGSVIQAANGKLYGMTSKGGTGKGVLFEYDPLTGNYVAKVMFNEANGNEPQGGLIQASNGKLYGMTYLSGTANSNRGVLFEYDPVISVYAVKVEFNNDNGSRPYGDLVETNGKLYGMTREGGINASGVLFEFDPVTAILTKKVDFGGTNGRNPMGTLCLASNGKLYGLASVGNSGSGLIFEYDVIANTFTKKADFDFDNGSNPMGSLMQSSNGKLYGLSSYGGSPELGTMFSFDIASNTITKLITFDGTNGSTPYYTKLIEVSTATMTTAESNRNNVKLYPNPVEDVLYLQGISKANVSIYNATGQKILSKYITNGELDVNSLAKGVYVVKVETEGTANSHKIVKK
jgi:uncharacterized repeat protein (TIGR03803 family)